MRLTARERAVVEHLVRGHTNKQIAAALGISPHSVRDHVSSLLAKSGACSRTQLALLLAHSHRKSEPPAG